jgi:thymidylate kinase
MATMAIIGGDGAGKPTVAKRLEADDPARVRYIYMGANIESSNVALPTSRAMLRFKLWLYARRAKRKGITDPSYVSTHHEAHRSVKYGPVLGALRTANKLAEACYRQLVSWWYQRRGYVVIYDRHLLFDAALGGTGTRTSDRVHYRLLRRFHPRVDISIFLDAPPDLLLRRKGEGTLDDLEQRRNSYLREGRRTANFVVVDASMSIDEVVHVVSRALETVRIGTDTPRATG